MEQKRTNYSGANPVPTIKRWLESLDEDKKDRDKLIDEEERLKKKEGTKARPQEGGKSRKKVTDPVTGKEVEIEDMNGNCPEDEYGVCNCH